MKPQPYTSIFIILASIGFTLLIATAIDPHSGSRTNLADKTVFDEVLGEDMARAIYANNLRKMNAAAPVFYRNGEIVEVAPKKRESKSKVEDTSDSGSQDSFDDPAADSGDDTDADKDTLPKGSLEKDADDKKDEADKAATVKDDDGKDDDKKKDKKDKKSKKGKKKKAKAKGVPMGLVMAAGGTIVALFVLMFLFKSAQS